MSVDDYIDSLKRELGPEFHEELEKLRAKLKAEGIATVGQLKQASPATWAKLGLSDKLEQAMKSKLFGNVPPGELSNDTSIDAMIDQMIEDNPEMREELEKLRAKLKAEGITTVGALRNASEKTWAKLGLTGGVEDLLRGKLFGSSESGKSADSMSVDAMIDQMIKDNPERRAELEELRRKLKAEGIKTVGDLKKASEKVWDRLGLSAGLEDMLRSKLFDKGLPDELSVDDMIDQMIQENPERRAELEALRQKLKAEGIKTVGQLKNASDKTWAKLGLSKEMEDMLRGKVFSNGPYADDASIDEMIDALKRELGDEYADELEALRQKLKAQGITTVGKFKNLSDAEWEKLGLSAGLNNAIRSKLFPNGMRDGTSIDSFIDKLIAENPERREELEKLRQKLKAEGILNVGQLKNASDKTWAKLGLSAGMESLLKGKLFAGDAQSIDAFIDKLKQELGPEFADELEALRRKLKAKGIKNIGDLKNISDAMWKDLGLSGALEDAIRAKLFPDGALADSTSIDEMIDKMIAENPEKREELEALRKKLKAAGITNVGQLKLASAEQWKELGLSGALEDAIRAKLFPDGFPDHTSVDTVIDALSRELGPEYQDELEKLRAKRKEIIDLSDC
jgi:regulator of replication initiation timing